MVFSETLRPFMLRQKRLLVGEFSARRSAAARRPGGGLFLPTPRGWMALRRRRHGTGLRPGQRPSIRPALKSMPPAGQAPCIFCPACQRRGPTRQSCRMEPTWACSTGSALRHRQPGTPLPHFQKNRLPAPVCHLPQLARVLRENKIAAELNFHQPSRPGIFRVCLRRDRPWATIVAHNLYEIGSGFTALAVPAGRLRLRRRFGRCAAQLRELIVRRSGHENP